MTKRGGYWATATAIALLMAGCSTPATETVETATSEQPATETAAPLTVDETPAPSTEEDAEAAFLEGLRPRLTNITTATDEQLVQAGHQSCELYAKGQGQNDQRLVEGEEPDMNKAGLYLDSSAIAYWAGQVLCPEFG